MKHVVLRNISSIPDALDFADARYRAGSVCRVGHPDADLFVMWLIINCVVDRPPANLLVRGPATCNSKNCAEPAI
jgi:hypothetical protein